MRFLGVPETADACSLLGLPAGTRDAPAIEAALRFRLSQVYMHPQGKSEDAEGVRRRLREAASTLLGGTRAPPRAAPAARTERRPAPLRLTEFDRQVLAILAQGGGWNARTSELLLAFATSQGVTVPGLVKVIAGLYEHEFVHDAAERPGPADPGFGPATPFALISSEEPPQPGDFASIELHAPRRQPQPVSTLSLSVLFGLLTVLTGLLVWRLLAAPVPRSRAGIPPAALVPSTPATTQERNGGESAPPGRASAEPAGPGGEPAVFPRRPGFQGQALTAEVASAADSCRRVAGNLAELGRRLAVAGEPSAAIFRAWEEDLRTVATGWVLLDEGLLDEIHRSIAEALFAASDSPTVTDRLLLSLVPPTGRRLEPVDLWRGAWMCGTLARIASSRNASAAVVESARAHLDVALAAPAGDFAEAAGAWLDRAVINLVEVTDRDPRAYDLWESWIAAQRRLGRGEQFQRAVMHAIELILADAGDLAKPGPAVNVLGRLLTLADFRGSATVQQRLLGFFDDQQRIGSRGLWVLTSLLATGGDVPWFGADLVLPEDADWLFRRRAADRIADHWPQAASSAAEPAAAVAGVPVEPALAASWLASMRQLESEAHPRSNLDRLRRLVALRRLNAAAAQLAFGRGDGVVQIGAEALRYDAADASGAPAAPGAHPVAVNDGEFAVAWEKAGRNLDDRMKLLRGLRDTAGSDLGPLDAETLVHAVYREASPELRELAADVLLEKFTAGPNVAIELLDQLPGAPASEMVSDTISRLTGRLLPPLRSESWRAEARLSLVDFNLGLRDSPDRALDLASAALAEACDRERGFLEPDAVPAETAVAAAEALVESWRRHAAKNETRRGVPADLVELERRDAMRRRLAEGPVQRYVAAQIARLDLMAYVASAHDPALREALSALLAESAAIRQKSGDVLDQALEAELAASRLWAIQVLPGPPAEASP